MAEATRDFFSDCEARGLRPKTLEGYRWALARLALECDRLPIDRRAARLVLAGPGLGAVSRHDLRRMVGRFLRWCQREYGYANPLEGMDRLPKAKALPRVLNDRELAALFAAACTPRDRALLAVLMDTGIRLGELASLVWAHVGKDHLVVNGKTGPRRVPISSETRALLEGLGDRHYIWTGRRGVMTRNGLQRVYRDLFALAGIAGPKTGPHVLRHTFATMYLADGGNIRVLQEILGHASLATTMVYLHLSGREVAQDHAAHSPLRSLGLISKLGVGLWKSQKD